MSKIPSGNNGLITGSSEIYIRSGDRWVHYPCANITIESNAEYSDIQDETGKQQRYRKTQNWSLSAELNQDENGIVGTWTDPKDPDYINKWYKKQQKTSISSKIKKLFLG